MGTWARKERDRSAAIGCEGPNGVVPSRMYAWDRDRVRHGVDRVRALAAASLPRGEPTAPPGCRRSRLSTEVPRERQPAPRRSGRGSIGNGRSGDSMTCSAPAPGTETATGHPGPEFGSAEAARSSCYRSLPLSQESAPLAGRPQAPHVTLHSTVAGWANRHLSVKSGRPPQPEEKLLVRSSSRRLRSMWAASGLVEAVRRRRAHGPGILQWPISSSLPKKA